MNTQEKFTILHGIRALTCALTLGTVAPGAGAGTWSRRSVALEHAAARGEEEDESPVDQGDAQVGAGDGRRQEAASLPPRQCRASVEQGSDPAPRRGIRCGEEGSGAGTKDPAVDCAV